MEGKKKVWSNGAEIHQTFSVTKKESQTFVMAYMEETPFSLSFLPNEFNSISVVSRIVRYRSANSGRVCCAANFFAPCGVLPAEILIF
jgi:hypothetical protein